jgi:hypothetical protein
VYRITKLKQSIKAQQRAVKPLVNEFVSAFITGLDVFLYIYIRKKVSEINYMSIVPASGDSEDDCGEADGM